MKRNGVTAQLVLVLLALGLTGQAHADPNPVYGSCSDQIGTFNGWTAWVGWDATFSELYDPVSETYAWVVYFAPEAVYVALQPAQALYSGVDVNMGFDYFYGFLKAPGGASTLQASYIESLWGVAFSMGTFDASPPAGPLSQLSIALNVAQTFFRVAHTQTVLPAVQFAAGVSGSFSLLPVSLPLSVSLDRDWDPPGERPRPSRPSWPLAIWDRTNNPALGPVPQVIEGLEYLAQNPGFFPTSQGMAQLLLPVLQQISTVTDLQSFLADPDGASGISQARAATKTWLASGDTGNLPENVDPPMSPQEMFALNTPILAGTQMAFESAYRAGAEANPHNHTLYIDGVVTCQCWVGEICSIDVFASELAEAVQGTTPADFEGTWLGFDVSVEYFMTTDAVGGREWIQIIGGKARYVIAQSLTMPQAMGIVYDDGPYNLNGGNDVELRRCKLNFQEPGDTNSNGIADFWEERYGLTNSLPGADSDKDGVSDEDEYIADTNPTNDSEYFMLQFAEGAPGTLVLPFNSPARRYFVQTCANLTQQVGDGWGSYTQRLGVGRALEIDMSPYLEEESAFFRAKASLR